MIAETAWAVDDLKKCIQAFGDEELLHVADRNSKCSTKTR
jgi:hypothetical protein